MFWIVKSSTLICTTIFCCSFLGDVTVGQEVELDQEATDAIRQIESLGGRVMRIAANTDQYEACFHLASVPVKDESLALLRFIPNLVWLNLANTEITDDGLRQIADLPLAKLHLEKTQIGNKGLEHLEKLKNLEYLNIYATKVGDEGLSHLKGLTNLKKLYVWQSSVTESGIKELQTALPEVEIVGELSFKSVEQPSEGENAKADDQGETGNDPKPEAKQNDKAELPQILRPGQ